MMFSIFFSAVLNSFLPIRRKKDGREELSAGRVLLQSRCLAEGESAGNGLATVRYMECLAPPNEVSEQLKCLCLQPATLSSEEEEDDIRREGSRKLVAAGEWLGVISLESIVSTVHVI